MAAATEEVAKRHLIHGSIAPIARILGMADHVWTIEELVELLS
jgi:hypothetical protein